MKCKQDECEQEAVYRFTWPGREESVICETHVGRLRQVADAMGMYLQVRPLDTAAAPRTEGSSMDELFDWLDGCGLDAEDSQMRERARSELATLREKAKLCDEAARWFGGPHDPAPFKVDAWLTKYAALAAPQTEVT